MNMTSLNTTILIYDPAGRMRDDLSEYLRSLSYIVLACSKVDEVLEHLDSEPGYLLADASVSSFEAERLLTELDTRFPEASVVLCAQAESVSEYFGQRLATEFPMLMLPASHGAIDHMLRRASSINRLVKSTVHHRDALEMRFEALKSHADGLERHNVKLQREHSELSKAANRQHAELKSHETSRKKLVRVRSAVDSAHDGMLIMDLEGRVEYTNPAYDEMFGEPREAAGPYSLDRVFEEPGMACKLIEAVSVMGSFTCDATLRHKNDGRFPGIVHANRIDSHDHDSGGILFIFTDVTEKERLRQQAQFDALTGSYGRRYFMEILAGNTSLAGRHGHGLALVMCDLDKFKEVNDTYGHRMGDKVLMTFAEVVRSEVRQEDVLGRFGGDEFMILFPHVEASAITSCLERIRRRFEEIRFKTDTGQSFSVSATMGVSDYPGDKISTEEYIELADQSLYTAKEAGRNCIVVNGRLA